MTQNQKKDKTKPGLNSKNQCSEEQLDVGVKRERGRGRRRDGEKERQKDKERERERKRGKGERLESTLDDRIWGCREISVLLV